MVDGYFVVAAYTNVSVLFRYSHNWGCPVTVGDFLEYATGSPVPLQWLALWHTAQILIYKIWAQRIWSLAINGDVPSFSVNTGMHAL